MFGIIQFFMRLFSWDTLLSLVTDSISDVLSIGIKKGKIRRKLRLLKRKLQMYIMRLQKRNQGSILEKGAFLEYLKYQKTIERIYEYGLNSNKASVTREKFIRSLIENTKVMLKLENIDILPMDESVLKELYTGLLEIMENFLQTEGDKELQSLLYTVNQIKLGSREMLETLKAEYTLQMRILQKLETGMLEMQDRIGELLGLHIDDEWFLKQNKEAILNMGKRYLPELNVDLDIKKDFDAIAANNSFFENLKTESERLLLILFTISKDDVCLLKQREKILKIQEEMKDFSGFSEKMKTLIEEVEICEKLAEKKCQELQDKRKNGGFTKQDNSLMNRYWEVRDKASEYLLFLNQKKMNLVKKPLMLLKGEGGIGKSHLIADTVCQRNQYEERSILLLGQDFPAGCIIEGRILELLKLHSSADTVLQVLNGIAMERNSRILVFLDAINEGGGKSVWKDKVAALFEKVLAYEWLGLIISIRSDFIKAIFEDEVIEKYEVTVVEHHGFTYCTRKAIQKYFDFYKIDMKSMPYLPKEFSNPLFLRLFCEGQKGKKTEISSINTRQIYRFYIDEVNHRMAERYGYSPEINIVYEVIETFVLKSYEEHQRNRMGKEKAIPLIEAIALKHQIPSTIYETLISEGILADGIDVRENEYVFITYERLADYIYAEHMYAMISEGTITDEDALKKINMPGILEEMNILFAANSKELMERFPTLQNEWRMVEAFNNGIVWRTDAGLKGKEIKRYIQTHIISDSYYRNIFYENLIQISGRPDHPYNAKMVHQYLMKMSMAERDAAYMETINSWKEEGALWHLLEWCLETARERMQQSEETIYLVSLLLSWVLISTDNYLRDYVSIVLCQFLRGHIPVMIRLLQSFETVDDVYITERLYAVAFGILTYEQEQKQIQSLEEWVYQHIFNQEEVIPDLLIRDYTRHIVLLAESLKKNPVVDMKKVEGPYNSEFPEIPSDGEIGKLYKDYKDKDFQDGDWAQNSILSSMEIDNHSGAYGDFGRYIFQNYFENWRQLDPNNLVKIAVKDIFSRGYQAKLHGTYDRSIPHIGRMGERKTERIGKKYQWQALYKLAAEVSDNYMTINEATGMLEYNVGSYEPSLRQFDPTINILKTGRKTEVFPDIFSQDMEVDNETWLKEKTDLPSKENLIELNVGQDSYVLLSGWHRKKEITPRGTKEYEVPLKEMWFMVQAYIVKEEDYDFCIQSLEQENFWGRWMPEAHDNYTMFNREYYWSDTQDYYDNEYYGGNEWKKPWRSDRESLEKISFLVPNYIYQATGEREIIGFPYHSWKKPCRTLVKELHLKYHDNNTIMYNEAGKMVCFDTCELFDKDVGLYFQREILMDFLNQNHYRIIWTVLGEKRVIGGQAGIQKDYDMPEYSGLFYYARNGELCGDLKEAEE